MPRSRSSPAEPGRRVRRRTRRPGICARIDSTAATIVRMHAHHSRTAMVQNVCESRKRRAGSSPARARRRSRALRKTTRAARACWARYRRRDPRERCPSFAASRAHRSQRSKNCSYVSRTSPSITASRCAYKRRARPMNLSGVSGVFIAPGGAASPRHLRCLGGNPGARRRFDLSARRRLDLTGVHQRPAVGRHAAALAKDLLDDRHRVFIVARQQNVGVRLRTLDGGADDAARIEPLGKQFRAALAVGIGPCLPSRRPRWFPAKSGRPWRSSCPSRFARPRKSRPRFRSRRRRRRRPLGRPG